MPVQLLDGIIGSLNFFGRIFPAAKEKAELARIGRYYATESMLVFDAKTGSYSNAATPSTGSETLFDYYAARIAGKAIDDRADHAVF